MELRSNPPASTLLASVTTPRFAVRPTDPVLYGVKQHIMSVNGIQDAKLSGKLPDNTMSRTHTTQHKQWDAWLAASPGIHGTMHALAQGSAYPDVVCLGPVVAPEGLARLVVCELRSPQAHVTLRPPTARLASLSPAVQQALRRGARAHVCRAHSHCILLRTRSWAWGLCWS